MFRCGGMLAQVGRLVVRGNPVSLVEALYDRLGISCIHLFLHQAMGDAVEVPIHIDMVIDV
jgi:hypothetical protein